MDKTRSSGIFLHITSLPSPYGIGDLGRAAYAFIDFLAEAKQQFWQVLPLHPTRLISGNSPYSSPSAFAGNTLLIDPAQLCEQGYLSKRDMRVSFPKDRVDYAAVTRYKTRLFKTAYLNACEGLPQHDAFQQFCAEHAEWLDPYALYTALRQHFKGRAWHQWPPATRNAHEIGRLREQLHKPIEMEKFLQYLFFKQWFALKQYGLTQNVRFIGDIPIYMRFDSADVWTHPDLFQLRSDGTPRAVSGVPPDFFSKTGQLWKNPLYRWDELKKTGYRWWICRLAHNLKLFDYVRLDHFKGFVDYWEVPAGEKTAVRGRWVTGPRDDFFQVVSKHFPDMPFIAEDLGVITEDVHRIRDQFNLPGMRILQFSFGNDPLADFYRPHNYIPDCVAYTGTHDNTTLMGWLASREKHSTRKGHEIQEQENALRYVGREGTGGQGVHWAFIRLLMMSAARLVIFPIQDILGLGDNARLNKPGVARGNWEWRLSQKAMTPSVQAKLAEMTATYGRQAVPAGNRPRAAH